MSTNVLAVIVVGIRDENVGVNGVSVEDGARPVRALEVRLEHDRIEAEPSYVREQCQEVVHGIVMEGFQRHGRQVDTGESEVVDGADLEFAFGGHLRDSKAFGERPPRAKVSAT